MSKNRKVFVPGAAVTNADSVDDTQKGDTDDQLDPVAEPEPEPEPEPNAVLKVPRIASGNELPDADSVDASKIASPVLTKDGWVVPRGI